MPTGCAMNELLTEAKLNMYLLPWNPRQDGYAHWLAFDALKMALPNHPDVTLTFWQQRTAEADMAAEWIRTEGLR